MVGIALDLGGATLLALDEDAGGVAALNKRAGKIDRLAGDQLFGRFDVGDDLFLLVGANARGETG